MQPAIWHRQFAGRGRPALRAATSHEFMKRQQIQPAIQFAIVAALACCLSGCLALSGSGNSNNTGANGGGTPVPGGGTGGSTPLPSTPGPNNGPTGDISSINHIVFMSQENRSFDTQRHSRDGCATSQEQSVRSRRRSPLALI